jgi:hypothetical protein
MRRVLNRIGLENDASKVERLAQWHDPALSDWIGGHRRACFGRRIDRAWGAGGQPADMIGVAMGQRDFVRQQGLEAPEPIGAAIGKNSGIGVGDEQRTVAPVPLVSLANVRPGSDEGQQHLGNLVRTDAES